MSTPFIFIGTYQVKPGKLEEFKAFWEEFWTTLVEPEEPQLLAFNAYANAETSQLSVVQVHPDEASMFRHMSLIPGHVAQAYTDYLEPGGSYQIFGTPGTELINAVQQMSGSDEDVDVKGPLSGFTRLGVPAT